MFETDDDWSLQLLDDEEEEDAAAPVDKVVAMARGFSSGRAAARIVSGNGKFQPGAGADIMQDLDFKLTCTRMLDAELDTADRLARTKAIGDLAQVLSNANALREAGAVTACVSLLEDPNAALANAAADAIRHLACASNPNRIAAREAGAIPKLVRILARVADMADLAVADDLAREQVAAGTSATAALRNLAFQNGPNRDLICFAGGLEPLTRIVATGHPPRPPPIGTPRREAAYRAAGALENLSSDHDQNAAAIVKAGVVPAMVELLIGGGSAVLSQKAARKGREGLFALMAREKAARALARQAEDARMIAAEEVEVETSSRVRAAVLSQMLAHADRSKSSDDGCAGSAAAGATHDGCGRDRDGRSGGTASCWSSQCSDAFKRRAEIARAQSELSWLTDHSAWACDVLRFLAQLERLRDAKSSDGDMCKDAPAAAALEHPVLSVSPPSPLVLPDEMDKAHRSRIHRFFKGPLFRRLLRSRLDSSGRIVVEALQVDPSSE
jgi:hypothetical protein